MDKALDSLVATQRESLRTLVSNSDSLITDLIDRGRAPTGNFGLMQSLGFVEIDRGETDLRTLVSQLLSSLLDTVTEEDFQTGCITYGEPITISMLLERLDWCVTSVPLAQSIFPSWREQDDHQRLQSVFDFVNSTLRDYHLRLLEVAEIEEPVPDELGLPSYESAIEDLRLFKPILTVNDTVIEITSENAGDVRDWLSSLMFCQGSKLSESQQVHLVEALRHTDSLCPVSMGKWIP